MGSMPYSALPNFKTCGECRFLFQTAFRAHRSDGNTVDVHQSSHHAEDQQDDKKDRPGLEPGIDLPTDKGGDDHRRHEFDERSKSKVCRADRLARGLATIVARLGCRLPLIERLRQLCEPRIQARVVVLRLPPHVAIGRAPIVRFLTLCHRRFAASPVDGTALYNVIRPQKRAPPRLGGRLMTSWPLKPGAP